MPAQATLHFHESRPTLLACWQAPPEAPRIRWSPDSTVKDASAPQPEQAHLQAPLQAQQQVQHDSPARGLAPELRRYASFTKVRQASPVLPASSAYENQLVQGHCWAGLGFPMPAGRCRLQGETNLP